MSTSKQFCWGFGIRSVCFRAVAMLVAGAASVSAQSPATPPPPAPAAARVLAAAPDPAEVRDSLPVLHIIAPETNVSVVQLQTRTLEFSKRIEVVDGFNPEILHVSPVSPTQIRLRADTTGVTSMTVKDETGAIFNIEVFVEGDVRELKAYIQRLFPARPSMSSP